MKELYEKPTAEWIEFEAERIMLSLEDSGNLGDVNFSGVDDGVGEDDGWD